MLVFDKSFFLGVADICLLAGKAILKEYEKPLTKVSLKEDSSPVTEADLRADEIIVEKLLKLDRTIPCLSEESTRSNFISDEKMFWAVDPLDGTREFLKKTGDFTVNIGLIKNKKPIFGIVYAPVFDKIWLGYIDNEEKIKESFRYESVTKHAFPLKYSQRNRVKVPFGDINILTSRSHPSTKTLEWLDKYFKPGKTIITPRGSSIKICLIAEGNGHIYPRFGRTCIWDTAAGHAIVNSSGGSVTVMGTKSEMHYRNSIYNVEFLVANKSYS